MAGKLVMTLSAVSKEGREIFDLGAIFEHENDKGAWLSLAPKREASNEGKYPSLILSILDADGNDITEDYFINVYRREPREERQERAPRNDRPVGGRRSPPRRRTATTQTASAADKPTDGDGF